MIVRLLFASAMVILAAGPAGAQVPDALTDEFGKPAPGAPIQLFIRGAPGWFRIGVPVGWQLGADRISGRVRVGTADGRSVRMWPVFLPRALDAREAASLLRALNAQIAPKAPWSEPAIVQRGPRLIVSAHARDGAMIRVTGMSLVSADGVTRALHAAATAPAKTFHQNRDLLAAVMESFQPLPGYVTGDPDLEQIAFERWTDPVERAFSLNVPKGWTVQGGTVRKAASDVRQTVQLRSPDLSVMVFAGDADIPLFSELPAEKQPNGGPMARPYEPGHEFARRYLDGRVRPLMPDLVITTVRPLPKLEARLQAVVDAFAGAAPERSIAPGEAVFQGTLKGRPAQGYLYAATSRMPVPGREALWTIGDIGSLFGFVATEDRIPTAVALIERMWTSFETNPQWFRDTRAIGAVSRIAAESRRYVSGALERAYKPRRATAAARYARHKTDVVPIRDPATGTDHMVQAGSNYFWLDDRGFLVGTERPVDPDPLWLRELLSIAP